MEESEQEPGWGQFGHGQLKASLCHARWHRSSFSQRLASAWDPAALGKAHKDQKLGCSLEVFPELGKGQGHSAVPPLASRDPSLGTVAAECQPCDTAMPPAHGNPRPGGEEAAAPRAQQRPTAPLQTAAPISRRENRGGNVGQQGRAAYRAL